MGCTESRDQGIKAELKNYTVIQGSFVSGALKDGGYMLAPLDQLEYNWKKNMSETAGYGPWADRALNINDELKHEDKEDWPMTLT